MTETAHRRVPSLGDPGRPVHAGLLAGPLADRPEPFDPLVRPCRSPGLEEDQLLLDRLRGLPIMHTSTAARRAHSRAVPASVATILALAVVALMHPVGARADDLDPAALDRGADPAVSYMIRDTIHDGERRVPATRLGTHTDLWTTSRGYVLYDSLRRNRHRLVHIDHGGDKRVLDTFRGFAHGVTVSPGGQRIAWGVQLGRDGPPSRVTVADPATGRVLATRRFHWAHVLGVTGTRVLLTRAAPMSSYLGGTWWWNYRRDTFSKVSQQHADLADVAHDRVSFRTGDPDRFCGRIAPLSRPERTLWRTCGSGIGPRRWSPNGDRALATYGYFDDTGTPLWSTLSDPTGQRLGTVTARLDWEAVWEGNRHFLVIAQNDDGIAAIVRCNVAGTDCEQASRMWDMGPVDYQPSYVAPPVVLPNN